jgi:hypothetical protein
MHNIDTAHLLYCAGYWLAGAYCAIEEATEGRMPLHRAQARAVRLQALAAGAVEELYQRRRPSAPRLAAVTANCGQAVLRQFPTAGLRVADEVALLAACGELQWQ